MRKILIILGSLIFLAVAGVGGYRGYQSWLENRFLTTPPEAQGRELTFRVPKGQPFVAIARDLEARGLITDRVRFVRLAVVNGLAERVRAGQFLLNTGWTPMEILTELTSSPGVMTRLSVREGLTWWQTAAKVAEAGLGSPDTFGAAVNDPGLLRELGIQASSAEGYLFPDTYLLTPPDEDISRSVAELMIRQFFLNAHKLWPGGLPPWKQLHEIVTLASLVEKEAGDAGERRRIAGVFANRLRKRMPLQADPTTIYGLGRDFGGNLTRDHLRDKANPYNTYMHGGLPPGPICSPGLESLRAAMDPEQHKYLYFVAKGDGTHQFSATLTEHNQAVRRYQLRRNRQTYRSTKE